MKTAILSKYSRTNVDVGDGKEKKLTYFSSEIPSLSTHSRCDSDRYSLCVCFSFGLVVAFSLAKQWGLVCKCVRMNGKQSKGKINGKAVNRQQ